MDPLIVTQAINVVYAVSTLAVLALGLAVIFGLLGVLNIAHGEIRQKEAAVQRTHYRRIRTRRALQLIHGAEYAAQCLIAIADDRRRLRRIFLVGVGEKPHRVLLHQIVLDCQRTGIVQVACASAVAGRTALLPGWGVGLQRIDDLQLALV